MGNKCWNCARVGKCLLCKPCDKFIRFRAYVTTKEVAALCGTTERTLFRKMRKSSVNTLSWIEDVTGFAFCKEYINDIRSVFVLETNNVENSVRLATALLEIERASK